LTTVYVNITVSAGSPADTPTFSPIAGTYTSVQSVTITCATPASTIYYTTNGTNPTTGSTPYTVPVSVGVTETLKAIAVATDYSQSAIGSAAYTITLAQAATPTFSPVAGTYGSDQTVTISCATGSSSIYYTTDGSTPTYPITGTTQAYSTPLSVTVTETIKAIATAAGYLQSAVGSATYTISFALTFPNQSIAAATQFAAYSQSLTGYVSGGTPPYTFSAFVNNGVNIGWALSTPHITGNPNLPFSDQISVKVTDSATPTPASVTATLTIPVNYVVPAGAAALGYTNPVWLVINPTLSNVNLTPTYGGSGYDTEADFYIGYWGYGAYSNTACFTMVDGVLQLAFNTTGVNGETDMTTQQCTSVPAAGYLPWIPNASGWYVDFGIKYTSHTSDCFGAVWMQATEYNQNSGETVNPLQTAYLKQWLEVDVWEAGNTGNQGAIGYHNGVSGTQATSFYQNSAFTSPTQTNPHVYGASYNPTNGNVAWYIDNVTTGNKTMLNNEGTESGVVCNQTSLNWLNEQYMYALWSMQTHGSNTPYSMAIYYITAWVG
jgi:hypothetical protein